MSTVNTHSELNRLALKHGVDAAYAVWLSLRQAIIDESHSGHFTRESAYQQSMKLGLNFSRRNFNRIILQGRDIFWGTDTERIYMRSFDRVYKLLADDTARLNRNPKTVQITLHKSLALRRAEFYWSWLMARGESTIARETLTDLFNLSPDQQRGYERLLGKRLVINTNYCHINADLYPELTDLPAHHFYFLQETLNDGKIEYVNTIAYQLPNTYLARTGKSGESSVASTPKRHLRTSRTLYRLTLACSQQKRCYYDFWDEYERTGTLEDYIRTAYQGKKRIHRQGQYF